MSVFHNNILAGAAGGASGPLYVDDVFSCFLYKGTSATRSINNGIDLDGEGGLVWIKARNMTTGHIFTDTERGVNKYIRSNSSDSENTNSSFVTAFNSDGFSLGDGNSVNGSFLNPKPFASWTFRKAPKFFDVVTYSGTSSSRTVSHNLGSVPGCIIIKSTSASGDWYVYHRDLGTTQYYELNNFNGPQSHSAAWGGTAPTATEFSLGFFSNNVSGRQYVAYLFAHDESDFGANEDESIVYCGSFSSAGGETQREVNIGWEPQFLLRLPDSSGNGNTIHNAMSGFGSDDFSQYGDISKGYQFTTSNDSAESNNGRIALTATGFKIVDSVACKFIAIRRPHKPPEAGTDVFQIDVNTQSEPEYVSNFVVDWAFHRNVAYTDNFESYSRLTGTNKLELNTTSGQSTNSAAKFDFMDGWGDNLANDTNYRSWMFRRAPGFFDVVNYSGTDSTQNINHNLTVIPELMFVKRRTSGGGWNVYVGSLGTSKYLKLEGSDAELNAFTFWGGTTPTSSVFTIGGSSSSHNKVGNEYIVYLFATLSGISKVGAYSGSSSDVQVDCGFTAGARFVLIKRTDGIGDWCLFDTTRGIVSGNDSKLSVNSTSAEDTGNDLIDPLSSGFTVVGGNTFINGAGRSYIYLAIA